MGNVIVLKYASYRTDEVIIDYLENNLDLRLTLFDVSNKFNISFLDQLPPSAFLVFIHYRLSDSRYVKLMFNLLSSLLQFTAMNRQHTVIPILIRDKIDKNETCLWNAIIISGRWNLHQLNEIPHRLALLGYRSSPEGNEVRTIKEPVVIYLPSKKVSLLEGEEITNACGEFMEALGFEPERKEEPVLGSFWQQLTFFFKKPGVQNQIDEAFSKGKKALELKHVDLPTAEQTEKLALAAEKIISCMEKYDEGVVRLGALFVLKKKVNGQSKIIIQQLSFELIKILDAKPQLLHNLQTVYELVTGDVKGAPAIDGPAAGVTV